jgi:hypothetical protein
MTLQLSESDWNRVYHQIAQDYGQTTVIISWRLRETLGFRVRRHHWYDHRTVTYHNDVRLDFDSEDRVVFFQLKYL